MSDQIPQLTVIVEPAVQVDASATDATRPTLSEVLEQVAPDGYLAGRYQIQRSPSVISEVASAAQRQVVTAIDTQAQTPSTLAKVV
ncbi:MAG: hypothetical protein AAF289_12425, partial [Cyanobacteria bacterium P01_A01_bin.135]